MSWLRFFRRRRADAELEQEMAFFLEEETADNTARGMTENEARRQARIKLGNAQKVRESLWAQNSVPRLENAWRDLRHAAKVLARSPGFTLTAILTLALSMGASTAIFSLINPLILRPLPVPHAEELVLLERQWTYSPGPLYSFSFPLFRALDKRHELFQSVAGFDMNSFIVRSGSGSVEVPGSLVSGEFFELMETPPLLGRALTPADDRPGGTSAGFAVVISEGFWRTWFNGAPDAIGRHLTIANAPFTVVGVMPASFVGGNTTNRADIYAPLWAEPVLDAPYSNIAWGDRSYWLRILARRRPGVSLVQANAALRGARDAILDESYSDAKRLEDMKAHHLLLAAENGAAGYSYLRTLFIKPLAAVFAMCAAMLLLACLNLAGLLMARSVARERELATRVALGASRMRLMQQLMLESFLIAVAGTAAGLAAAPAVSRFLSIFILGTYRSNRLDTALDWRVYWFAAAAAVVTALLIGLMPALRATSRSLREQIGSGSQAATRRRRGQTLPRALMGLEVALALVLVFGAGLLATSLARLCRVGLGFDPHGIVNLDLNMGKQPLDGDALVRWYKAYGDALARIPGAASVSFGAVIPEGGDDWTAELRPASGGEYEALMNQVSPGYFATMRISLLRGRDFRWNDALSKPREIILSETAAQRMFPGRSAIGEHVTDPESKNSFEVIAVVGDIRYVNLREGRRPQAYLPITQSDDHRPSYDAVVRLRGAAGPFGVAAERLLAQMAPQVPAPRILSMKDGIDASMSTERMMALLAIFFAACALLVTAIGLYGTLAYATARRTSEIGIRMALGAGRLRVVGLVFRDDAWTAASGAALGLAIALLASRALASFVYDTSVRDPWVLLGSTAGLMLVASAASLLPAVRAARLDPARTLRAE